MHKHVRFSQYIILTSVLLISMPLASLKAQAVQSSMEQLAKESDAVVVGRVAGLSSEWNETKTRIQTRVTISVDQSLKGDASAQSMTVIIPGGEVDGVGEIYSHAPRFTRDEAVVVFAKKTASGNYQVSHGNQGKYTILTNEDSSKRSVTGGQRLEDFTSSIKSALQMQELK